MNDIDLLTRAGNLSCLNVCVCVSHLQVDPSLKMDIVLPGDGKTKGVLFQLHPVTVLNL